MSTTLINYLNAQGTGQGGNSSGTPSSASAATAALSVMNATNLIVTSPQSAIQR
jgi:hypothetical protein